MRLRGINHLRLFSGEFPMIPRLTTDDENEASGINSLRVFSGELALPG
jgi:hypothetical protein